MEVVQHIQTTQFSLVVTATPPNQLTIRWEEVIDKFAISAFIIEHLERIVREQAETEKVALLIHTFPGISVDKAVLKVLQRPDAYEYISAVAIVLPSTTLRISLNVFSQLQNIPAPIRAFASPSQAQNWLNRKNQSPKKK